MRAAGLAALTLALAAWLWPWGCAHPHLRYVGSVFAVGASCY